MSQFTRFMKQNKQARTDVMYVATKSIKDENGEPIPWKLRPITTVENEAIKDDCTTEVKVKSHMFRPKLDTSKYMAMLICASVVEPNLHNAELQDSYNVKSNIDLLREMIDDPREYNELTLFVQKLNGFDIDFEEMSNQAKN